MQIIYLDISNKGVVPTIYAKQGDVGRKVQVIFMDSGIPYEIPENAGLSVWYDGDSGDGNYTDIGNKSAIVVENNKVTFELITQMLNNDGEGIVCLIMNVGEEQIGSWNIHYLCEKVPGFDSEAASSYFTAFSESVNKLKNTDKTLTKEGYPADAKATGDKIDGLSAADIGAAPIGYGLGEIAYNLTEITDANAATNNGWYLLGKDAANGFGYRGVMRVDAYSSSHLMQTLYTQGYSSKNPVIVQRTCVADNWSEWSFLNPIVGVDVEYRTTELHQGKPVYTQLFNLGAVTASGSTDITIAGLTDCIRYAGRIGNIPLPVLSRTEMYADAYTNGITVGWVCGHSSWIGRTAYCQIWYVKE